MADLKDVRTHVSIEAVSKVGNELVVEVFRRMQEKGAGSFIGRHEIIGCIDEEFGEAMVASHEKNRAALRRELLDVAGAVIFAIASMDVNPDDRNFGR